MIAVEAEHDTSAKTIFGGIQIPAGQTAEQDLESLLDALMAQPTMAPFVEPAIDPAPGHQQSEPGLHPARGDRVREQWRRHPRRHAGSSHGDSDRSGSARRRPAQRGAEPVFGHLREPVLFMANLLRGLNATLGAPARFITRRI
jgi:hypothetical protein